MRRMMMRIHQQQNSLLFSHLIYKQRNFVFLLTLFLVTVLLFQESQAQETSSSSSQTLDAKDKGKDESTVDDENCKSGNKTGGCPNKNETKLVLVQVIFRHGDRTPLFSWPTDPHHHSKSNHSVVKIFQRKGLLTKRGRVQAYELGTFLNSRYKEYLYGAWIPEDIHVQASEVERAIMTAQTCLAGLFPPTVCTDKEPGGCEGRWSKDIKWQPIPIFVIPKKYDNKINFQRENLFCPAFEEELDRVLNCDEMQTYVKSHQKIFDEVKEHTGLPSVHFRNIGLIHDTLYIQSIYELPLPNWTTAYFPRPLRDMVDLGFMATSGSRKMQKFNGGPLLKEVINNMKKAVVARCPFRQAKIKDKKGRPKKLYMFSGHDNTVSAFLATLGLLDPHQPAYTAAVIIELHEPLNIQANSATGPKDYIVKIFYRNATKTQAQEMIIPKCGKPCHLDKLVEMSSDLFVKNYELACQGLDGWMAWLLTPVRKLFSMPARACAFIKGLFVFIRNVENGD